jgi:protoheme IX farnesyltransferase
MLGLLRACHPEPAAAVTAGATLLAVIVGQSIASVVAAALAIGASQLAGGWHNDWLDAARDKISGRPDKPITAGSISRRAVGLAAAIAAAATVPLGLLSGPAAGLAATIGLLSVLAYNWRLKFTAFSVVPYVVSFGALPAFVVLGLPGSPLPPWWLVGAGASLGGGAHFANVLSDLDDDARTGVRGLPHRVGPSWGAALAGVLLADAGALLVFGPPGAAAPLAVVGLCTVVVVLLVGTCVQLLRPASRAAFRAVIIAALISVALLLTAGTVL